MNNKDLLIKEIMREVDDILPEVPPGAYINNPEKTFNEIKENLESFLESSLSRAFEEGVKNGWIACRREEDDKCECECEGCLEEHHCCNTKCGHKFNR